MLRAALVGLLVIHGLIHAIGFASAYGFSTGPFEKPVSAAAGIAWLVTAVLFICATLLVLVRMRYWGFPAAAGIVLSQVLITMWWHDARFGTIANVLLVCPIIVAIAGILPNSSSSQFRRLADDGFSRFRPPALVTDADLETLPAPVERYLRYVGVVGKPRIVNLKAQFRGSISATRDAPARAFTAEQVSFFDTSMRLFFIESSRSGLPFDALHAFVGPDATMRVKIASLVPVVDARGSEMNESETVTMFNDMCVLAPATLIDPAIRWETVSDSSVKATFTRNGVTIRAVLTFGANGELVNFTSSDRFQTSDGKTYHRFAWSTPVKNYRDYRGYRLASYGDATWHEPTGDFTYGHFELEDIRYNATTR